MNEIKPFGDYQLDVLREVGNIGAGHAATALATMLDRQVDMQVPKVSLVPFEQIAESVGGDEAVVIAIFLRVDGETPGNMFFLISPESAKLLLTSLVGVEVFPEGEYSEIELSALAEIGNILAGSYLSSLADFTHLTMAPTVPALAIDMAGAILSFGLLQFGHMGDHALLIDTMFFDGDDKVEGHFFFIPDPDSFHKIFRALGVPAGE
ncbi:chemotaxis protein CheC [Paenibacillus turpanensis]|uniref:chemotaxis protein CheC n=1 Tax=Paenibacillus turpanensis TaxID=2689078 RepID=UPI0014073D62